MELFTMMIFWFIASGLAMKMMRLQSKESVETAILKHPRHGFVGLEFWKWLSLSLKIEVDSYYKGAALGAHVQSSMTLERYLAAFEHAPATKAGLLKTALWSTA